MADQRIIFKHKDKEIVVAVRHSCEWRNAMEERNDIASFLNSLPADAEVEIEYEGPRGFCDPIWRTRQ
jgi:hypothetical protein